MQTEADAAVAAATKETQADVALGQPSLSAAQLDIIQQRRQAAIERRSVKRRRTNPEEPHANVVEANGVAAAQPDNAPDGVFTDFHPSQSVWIDTNAAKPQTI